MSGKETETRVSPPNAREETYASPTPFEASSASRKKTPRRRHRRSVVMRNPLPRRAVVAARRGISLTCKSKGVD